MNIETVATNSKANAPVDSTMARHAARIASDAERPQSVKQKAPTPDTVRAAAAQIDTYLKSIGRSLDIRVDDNSGRMVVTVRDTTTGETIRQIPSEEALKMAQSLRAGDVGPPVVFDELA